VGRENLERVSSEQDVHACRAEEVLVADHERVLDAPRGSKPDPGVLAPERPDRRLRERDRRCGRPGLLVAARAVGDEPQRLRVVPNVVAPMDAEPRGRAAAGARDLLSIGEVPRRPLADPPKNRRGPHELADQAREPRVVEPQVDGAVSLGGLAARAADGERVAATQHEPGAAAVDAPDARLLPVQARVELRRDQAPEGAFASACGASST
jgi:hypothetical protein